MGTLYTLGRLAWRADVNRNSRPQRLSERKFKPGTQKQGPQQEASDCCGASLGSSYPWMPPPWLPTLGQTVSHPPDEIAAEDEAKHEDKDACAKDDHVDVEGKVLETDGWHWAGLVSTNQSQAAETPCKERRKKNIIDINLPLGLMALCVSKDRENWQVWGS